MRLAVDEVQGQGQVGVFGSGLFHQRPQPGMRDGHHNGGHLDAPRQQRCGGEKRLDEMPHLPAPAARKHGQHHPPRGQAQRLARSGQVGFQRYDLGEGMTDVAGPDAGVGVNRRFEGKDAQHVIHRFADDLDALAPPGPDRRAHHVDDGDARLPQSAFELQVEIRRIDTDEGGRWRSDQPLAQAAADPQQFGQSHDHIGIAVDREAFTRPPGIEALGLHARAADACRAQAGGTRVQRTQHMRRQQISGRFSRDKGQGGDGHASLQGRTIPRPGCARNVCSTASSVAAAG
ncbi:hypothetical protein GALL_442130 [mine drainage metagenome]|uniref:Uncharacterized protein n=1 Tax=mine drainage metagenome TaxID=410659 RepID=A0A1J5Q9H7_9ZZZZ